MNFKQSTDLKWTGSLNNRVRQAIVSLIVLVLAGCPAPPPKTQSAGTPAQFRSLLSTVVTVGMTKEKAQHVLRYQEGLEAKEVRIGDFTEFIGKPNEKVHQDIHYLLCERTFKMDDGTLTVTNIAFVLDDDRVTNILANEVPVAEEEGEKTVEAPAPQSESATQPEKDDE